ncbi:MAG: hypothetical protein ACOY3P_24565 [Planctomycetota bacterium]
MAKESTRKRTPARQKMAELVSETEQQITERQETELKPEQRAAAKAAAEAVSAADQVSSDDVIRSIGELKSSVGRMLTQLADRLEDEVSTPRLKARA